MSNCVLDSSALIALFHQEPGSDKVTQAIEDGAAISTVNLAEVASKLNDLGAPEAFIEEAVGADIGVAQHVTQRFDPFAHQFHSIQDLDGGHNYPYCSGLFKMICMSCKTLSLLSLST